MNGKPGVEIEEVRKGSPAEQMGLLPDDRLVALNDHPVRDDIDLLFHGDEPVESVVVRRRGKDIAVGCPAGQGYAGNLGITTKPMKVKSCRNKCLFCFISQLPKGLRKSLYLKDEDYRMSFLYGNYITLTNLSDDDKRRIVEQRLSPLYISVHATDQAVRNVLLGNAGAPDIIREIRFLAEHRITMHTQIVLCPGYNDGKVLAKTIADLYKFFPYVQSIAVVPVGLTAHRKKKVTPVGKDDARNALETIGKFWNRFKRKHGVHIVYGADELYIKAELPFPPIGQYDDTPQIENGVGLVPFFLHSARRVRVPQEKTEGRFITFTGLSFFPFLVPFVDRIRKNGTDIQLVAVGNGFFGSSVTVTGLLTGRDVMKALAGIVRPGDTVLIPDVTMREGEEIFLDDVSRHDIEDMLGVRAVIIGSTPSGLISALKGTGGRSG